MIDDLEKPMFAQKQVLRMLPSLKPKTLQNWSARGILDEGDQRPGRQGKRLYSPLGVIMLDFMQKVGMYGVPPLIARDMADEVAEAALEYWTSKPEIITAKHSNCLWIPIKPETIGTLRRARISIYEYNGEVKSLFKIIKSFDDYDERIGSDISIVVEIDFMVAQTINRMLLHEAGEI